MNPMKYRMRIAWSVVLASTLGAGVAAGEPVAPEFLPRAVETLGFESGDEARVRAGEILSRAQDEAANELGAALALVIERPVGVVFDTVQRNEIAGAAGQVPIDPDDPETALAAMPIAAGLLAELRAAAPGGPLHLSNAELAVLRETSDADLADAYRGLLAERVRGYSRGGFEAIAPYARRRGVSEPGASLAASTGRLGLVREASVSMDRALREFPIVSSDAVEHQFWWEVNEVEGKPTPVLLHRIFHRGEDHSFISSREFYVARSYNALHVFVGLFSIQPDHSLVLYVNRTFTDQVAGVGSKVRHRVGRGMLVDEVSRSLAATRKQIERR